MVSHNKTINQIIPSLYNKNIAGRVKNSRKIWYVVTDWFQRRDYITSAVAGGYVGNIVMLFLRVNSI